MLSRYALRQVFGSGVFNSSKLCSIQPVRNCTTNVPSVGVAPPEGLHPDFDPRLRARDLNAKPEMDPNVRGLLPNEWETPPVNPRFVPIETQVANIKRAHEIFYGPERDMKNFPPPKMIQDLEPYNFWIIPTRYCKALYEKLGVSGSYSLFLGTWAFLLSKEILPVDHALPESILIFSVGAMLYKKFAPKAEAAMDKLCADRRVVWYDDPIAEVNAMLDEDVGVYEKDIWRLNAIPSIFEAKREQVGLQLEVVYRERLEEVYKAVKNRLDYQADRDFLERKFEQEHMVNWIVNNVKKSITPQQEKENIGSCIQTLKQLSTAV